MPAAFPGNSTTKLARAATGGGFESAITETPSDGSTIWGPYVNITQPAATIFSDDFATGDLSHVENGAEWTSMWSTSLVNGDGCVIYSSGGGVVDPPNCGFEARQWEGWLNNNAMRFRFGGGGAFAMQSWTFGSPVTRIRDAWFKLRLRVPLDYEHVNNSGASTNNKFFALFMDGRETNSDGGATVVFQTRMRGADVPGNVGSRLVFYVWNNQAGNGEVGGGFQDFWSVPEVEGNGARDDRTRWMDVVLHVVANDGARGTGIVQAWRRWQDASDYDLMINEVVDVPVPNSGYDGWNNVQIIGGDNSHLAENTEILMDAFFASGQPLVPAGTEGL